MNNKKILKATKYIIGTPGETHNSKTVTCPICKNMWETIEHETKHINKKTNKETKKSIKRILNTLTPKQHQTHPNKNCVDCIGCQIDLQMAYDNTLYENLNINPLLAWGPPHNPNTPHPKNYKNCKNCMNWKKARKKARKKMKKQGYNPNKFYTNEKTILKNQKIIKI